MSAQRRHYSAPHSSDRSAVATNGSTWRDRARPVVPPQHEPAPVNVASAASPTEPTHQKQPRARPERRNLQSVSLRRSPVLWGLFGFTLGVVFWHAIGFWSFIASVVLPLPSERESALGTPRMTGPRDATQPTARTISHARPTRTLQQQQQLVTGRAAATSAPPQIAEPLREMPLPGWGTTIVTSDRDGTLPQ